MFIWMLCRDQAFPLPVFTSMTKLTVVGVAFGSLPVLVPVPMISAKWLLGRI